MQIHFFQRYHSKENVDTANTMLMLSRLYNYNADKFFSMLKSLVLGENESPEISFDLQVVGNQSVPDAVISQKSFKIVVETKLHNQFSSDQLFRHLEQFASEDYKVLLTLDPKPMKEATRVEFADRLAKYNADHQERLHTPIKHVNLTFKRLLEAVEETVDERDTEIMSVLDDFRSYCFFEKLIPDGHKWMRAIVAGTSIADNIDLGLYYDKAAVRYSAHGYVGLYNEKCIKAIGKLMKIVIASVENGQLSCTTDYGEPPTEDEIRRIKDAIERAKAYGYNLSNTAHKFFIVDKFYETCFRKSSKNAIQKSKFFDLAKMFKYKQMPSTEQIAHDLDGRTWEEF